MQEERYLIGELANVTGLTVRTIRYYMDEQLLPTPQTEGKYAYFTSEYLARLKLIQRLKDSYLPLREIKRILDNLSDNEIKQYADKPDLSELGINQITQPGNRRALEYIEEVKRNQIREKSPPPRVNQPFAASPLNPIRESKESVMQFEGLTWRRIELRKGIEIHIDERIMSHDGGRILSIIEHFKRVLRSEL